MSATVLALVLGLAFFGMISFFGLLAYLARNGRSAPRPTPTLVVRYVHRVVRLASVYRRLDTVYHRLGGHDDQLDFQRSRLDNVETIMATQADIAALREELSRRIDNHHHTVWTFQNGFSWLWAAIGAVIGVIGMLLLHGLVRETAVNLITLHSTHYGLSSPWDRPAVIVVHAVIGAVIGFAAGSILSILVRGSRSSRPEADTL